ncbi:MAG: hypothetical protein ACR2H3_13665, partial [Acidimicrobiales bacterium]
CDLDDIEVALSLAGAPFPTAGTGSGARAAAEVSPEDQTVLDAVGFEPVSIEQIVARTGLGPAAAIAILHRLARAGLTVRGDGGRWEPVKP